MIRLRLLQRCSEENCCRWRLVEVVAQASKEIVELEPLEVLEWAQYSSSEGEFGAGNWVRLCQTKHKDCAQLTSDIYEVEVAHTYEVIALMVMVLVVEVVFSDKAQTEEPIEERCTF